jgi:hypothetical protein
MYAYFTKIKTGEFSFWVFLFKGLGMKMSMSCDGDGRRSRRVITRIEKGAICVNGHAHFVIDFGLLGFSIPVGWIGRALEICCV